MKADICFHSYFEKVKACSCSERRNGKCAFASKHLRVGHPSQKKKKRHPPSLKATRQRRPRMFNFVSGNSDPTRKPPFHRTFSGRFVQRLPKISFSFCTREWSASSQKFFHRWPSFRRFTGEINEPVIPECGAFGFRSFGANGSETDAVTYSARLVFVFTFTLSWE